MATPLKEKRIEQKIDNSLGKQRLIQGCVEQHPTTNDKLLVAPLERILSCKRVNQTLAF